MTLEERILKITLVVFDFDGVFTDNAVYVTEDGREMVRCWRGDGIGLRQVERQGIATIILSTEPNPVVAVRAQKLKIRCLHGVENKLKALEDVMQEMGIPPEQVAFVGNDVNDLACLQAVGLPIVVNDAHPDVVESAVYRTKICGGYGAVREICDLFVKVRHRY